MKYRIFAAVLACAALPVAAQENPVPGKVADPTSDVEWMGWVPDPSEIQIPVLDFVEDRDDRKNYEKYYYFHRADTGFAEALGDLRECDGLARGLTRSSFYPDTAAASAQYGLLAGQVGGAVVGALATAIFAPAEARLTRRVSMRRCMFYKGYARFGLDKDLWEAFNFEEGARAVVEEDRQRKLAQQALVASGERPTTQDLGL
ncbi:hypothetical protein K3152_07215 [Qipengyuania sp. 1NDH17]|uniref:Uncharacterized protein n=1 Tax=Qipengyuania polymorpha TaxID=2867234 RepID=A0ABS7J3K0_9SPHN|nr:hypothetical protein [Qipengyuania polymorpha]MBX7458033.1 hypothetical protein [Qipengyuania polymorpha]